MSSLDIQAEEIILTSYQSDRNDENISFQATDLPVTHDWDIDKIIATGLILIPPTGLDPEIPERSSPRDQGSTSNEVVQQQQHRRDTVTSYSDKPRQLRKSRSVVLGIFMQMADIR